MGAFEPAMPEVAYIKAGLYGATGSGKTLTSLLMATSLGRTVIFDTEQSGSLYAPKEGVKRAIDVPTYDRLATKNIFEITQGIETAYEEGYDAIIVDQGGHLWEWVQDYYLKEEEKKGSKAWYQFCDSATLPPGFWKKPKKAWKAFISAFLDTPIHAFICGRMTDEFGASGGDKLVRIGVKMEGAKDVMYEPTLLFQMGRSGGGKVKAFVEKDKTGFLQNQVFMNPNGEILKPVLEFLGKNVHKETPKDVEIGDTEIRMHPTAKLVLRLLLKEGYEEEEATALLLQTPLQTLEVWKKACIVKNFSNFEKLTKGGGKKEK